MTGAPGPRRALSRSKFVQGSAAAVATGTLGLASPAKAALQDTISGNLLLGMVGPFTGDDSRLGEQMQNGAQQACDETNRLRGTLDRQFSIRTFDDGDALASAITNSQFAVDDGAVVCVIGHLRGKLTEAALDTYSRAGMPVIVPVSTYDRITEAGYTNVVRLTTKDSIEGRLDAREVIAQHSPKLVVAVTIDDDYGPDVANGFIAEMQRAKVDARVLDLPYEKIEFAKAAASIVAAKPDVVYVAATVAQVGPLLQALHDGGYTGPVFASQGFFDPMTVAKFGPAAEGLTASSSMPPLNIAPSIHRLKTDYEEKYGVLTPLAAFGYASAQIVIAAYQSTGALDRSMLLHAIARPNTTYQTIVGDFTFSNSGDPQQPNVYFYAVQNGAWKYQHAAHPSGFLIK